MGKEGFLDVMMFGLFLKDGLKKVRWMSEEFNLGREIVRVEIRK